MPAASLAGKAALVTGGAVRVGRAIALALAQEGADVAVHYRSSEREAEEVSALIRSGGHRSFPVPGDLASPEGCRRVVRETLGGLGGLDFLIHSAANFHRASLEESDETLWDSAISVNARAGFLLAREAAGTLRERKGRVIFLSDFLALHPVKNYAVHSVSKAAVEGLVRALAVELAPEVSVNGIAPGTVLPPEGTPREQAQRWARKVPLKRNGEPEDIARTVLFLCVGPAFLTGQIIRVDGGKALT